MTSLQQLITDIAARVEKAEKGPWHTETEELDGEFGSGPDTMSGYKSYFVEDHYGKRICDSERSEHSVEVELGNEEDCGSAWDETGKRNLDFIAHAREDIPLLLQIIERQRLALVLIRGGSIVAKQQSRVTPSPTANNSPRTPYEQ